MNIRVEPEDQELHGNTHLYEDCVFCGEETRFWAVEYNRPVCCMCSVLYTPEDIAKAPHNY